MTQYRQKTNKRPPNIPQEEWRNNLGGPAFPHTVEYKGADCGGIVPHGGMTLRDYFAAKASEEDIKENNDGPMQEQVVSDGNGTKYITHLTTRYTREQAKYRYADAMLKARQA
jgi:hypothetical protein